MIPLLLLTGCASARMGDLDALKPTVETFHQRARWGDYRGAAELVVPAKRDAFLQARASMHDDKDLHITDYELEDARYGSDKSWAVCVSRINWYRLPSVSEQSVVVTSTFLWRDGKWYLDAQDGGPFADELVLVPKDLQLEEPKKDGKGEPKK